MIYTTQDIPFGHHGFTHYRIEIDTGNSRQHFQRHIWTRDDGSEDVNDWITSFQHTAKDLESGRFTVKAEAA